MLIHSVSNEYVGVDLENTVPSSDEDGDEIGKHTSELQSRETISYAVFCLKKKTLILYQV